MLYFSSVAVPALAAVFLVPVTVRALGPSRFGLLALAWAVAEGSGMFDFGLGRATVRVEDVNTLTLASAQVEMGSFGHLLIAPSRASAPLLFSSHWTGTEEKRCYENSIRAKK